MENYTIRRAYLELHIAIFLWGLTAILGDLIDLSSLVMVWWRLILTCASLLLFKRLYTQLKNLSKVVVWKMTGIGVIIALHWLCFYGAIKLGNASIALVMMATTPVFTTIFEPFFVKKKFDWMELGVGLIVIPAMYLIVDSVPFDKMNGVWVGLGAAIFCAIFSIMNKKLVDEKVPPMAMTFVELGAGCLFLSALLPFFVFNTDDTAFIPQMGDWKYLLILAWLCTTLTFILSLRAMKQISAFATNLSVNMEPIYGMTMAYFWLDDGSELNTTFYIGASIIIFSVAIYSFINIMKKRKLKKLGNY